MIHAVLFLLAFDAVPTPQFSQRVPHPAFTQRIPRPLFADRKDIRSSGAASLTEHQSRANKDGSDTAAHDATAAPSPAPSQPRAILWSAGWCSPCQNLKPSVARLQAAGWPVEVHDCDAERETFAGWGLRTVPCLQVIGLDGKELSRFTPGSAEQIQAAMQSHGVKQSN